LLRRNAFQALLPRHLTRYGGAVAACTRRAAAAAGSVPNIGFVLKQTDKRLKKDLLSFFKLFEASFFLLGPPN
jgi:hypothetical protein